MLKGQTFTLLVLSTEKAIVLPLRAARRNDAERRAEHIFHPLGLLVEVATFSLDDADRVDPKILQSKLSGSDHGVFERGRKVFEVDTLPVRIDVLQRSTEM